MREFRIIQGNALEVLRSLEGESVDCCVTSPPYWSQRNYDVPPTCWPDGWSGCLGLEPTPTQFLSHLTDVFREVRRVLRAGGTLWLNLGDGYANDSKWGGSTGGKHVQALHGNTGIGQRKVFTGLKSKDLMMIPARAAIALQEDGWYLRSDIIWHKPQVLPESVTDRPTKAHEYLFLLTKAEHYWYDAEAIKEPASPDTHARYARGRSDNHKLADGGPGNQTIATNKPGSKYAPGVNPKCAAPGTGIRMNSSFSAAVKDVVETRNKRTVWTIPTEGFSAAHFATFPQALVEPCVLAGCPRGGLVFDPFCGSGTVGVVALRHGRQFVGIELNPRYVKMAHRRIFRSAPLVTPNPEIPIDEPYTDLPLFSSDEASL